MRFAWRLDSGTKRTDSLITLGLLLTLSACSLPDVDVQKKAERANAAGAGFFTKDNGQGSRPTDKSYLATVRIRFTETMQPITFDVRRDRRDLISANLEQTQETSTYLHLGYTHSEGGIAGLRFAWHF